MSDNDREKWDRMAENYQAVFRLGLNEYNSSLLCFWKEKGMLPPGARVLDIGCGVGRYGAYLAELGYDVTLTDISGEMLRHAAENMARYQTPWAIYQCDFREATGREPIFSGGFDLSISTMSPAVCDAETVRKMCALTHGWCFLARFQDWAQPFRDKLMRAMGREPTSAFHDLKGDVEAMIRAVEEAGCVPHVKLVDYDWADRRTPEEMADYLCGSYFAEEADAERLRADALRAAESLREEDGRVLDAIQTKVAWIYWKTDGSA